MNDKILKYIMHEIIKRKLFLLVNFFLTFSYLLLFTYNYSTKTNFWSVKQIYIYNSVERIMDRLLKFPMFSKL